MVISIGFYLVVLVSFCAAARVDKAKCDALTQTHVWFNNHCFVVSDEKIPSFTEAQHACTTFDMGHLAYVTDTEENGAILEMTKAQFGTEGIVYWVGLEQIDKHKEPASGWQWAGGPINMVTGADTPWFPGTPDSANENCGDYLYQGGQGGVNDAPCVHDMQALCQYPAKGAKYSLTV